MEMNFAIRRQFVLPRLVIPPLGRFAYLVTYPKPTVGVVELDIVHSEQNRKCEELSQLGSECRYYDSSECAFCLAHGIWPRCGLQQLKRERQASTPVLQCDGHTKRLRNTEEVCTGMV